MECNKDEAIRAKEIAEKKFREKDFAGAKKFGLKAQNLYPELEGLSQMLVTLDVHLSAEKRTITGEVNYYSVLGISPWADDETIRKQYRKLALMLHPDKNKSLGADGAFKLVSEAWSLLSDKAKRVAYNDKLNVRQFQQKNSTHAKVSSMPSAANGFHNINSARTGPTSVPSPSVQKSDTFWTICNRCKTQYEYLRMYLNHTLLCPNCHEAFFAAEKGPPPNVLKTSNYSSRQKHHSKHHSVNSNMFNVGVNLPSEPDLQRNHSSRMAGAGGAVHQAHQQVKREHEESRAGADWRNYTSIGADQLFKRRKSDGIQVYSFAADSGLESASEQRKGYNGTERVYGFSGINSKPNSKRELSCVELRNMLMEKAQMDIRKKLEEWRSSQMKPKENKKQKGVVRNGAINHKKHDNSAVMEETKDKKSSLSFSTNNLSTDTSLSINVPDPDFHNFDLDRTERSFGDDQVWAAYDENDGMPRYYARIQKVISLKPFKMRISWLNSRSNTEFSSIDWVGSGFPKTCGDFRAGRFEVSDTLNSFSHKVKWVKGARGIIRILPSKGDVWAVYRNWSPDWNEHTPNEVVHRYDMVEVLDDYSEEQGVSVAPLIKVAGFKTVFSRHMDLQEVWKIPRDEMLRFSHQVPDHLLTGEEAHNAPKGCRELDPAATPLELLQVVIEANEAEMVDATFTTKEEVAPHSSESKIDQIIENSSEAEEIETIESDEQPSDS
ncbi:uncharacterized protein LOC126674071 [Mercurialis annua]|uniref:uncharacterized protein LOC126674071 n=1 Tax=Mercurialis annua TaxID=3986 RepID=UPI0021606477|nr:uncharacterized protein LOC126674071 [Mercurialis annua]